MAQDDENPNRRWDDQSRNRRNFDNDPLIALRRFADSHVSSLVNTVFTLPATLANFNNAYHAREQCLFGRADSQKCDRLKQLEDKTTQLAHEGQELYQKGDMQAMVAKSEELLRIDQEADVLRKDIVEQARGFTDDRKVQVDRARQTGDDRDRHWHWSWSWQYPKHSGDAERRVFEEDDNRGWRECRRQRELMHNRNAPENTETDLEQSQTHWRQNHNESNEQQEDSWGKPRVWSWSFQWPPAPDTSTTNDVERQRQESAFEDFDRLFSDEMNRHMRPFYFRFGHDSYSPRTLEQNEQMKNAGIHWRDAYEDLVRAEKGAPLLPKEQLGQSQHMSYHQWSRRFWDPQYPHVSPLQRYQRSAGEYPKRVPWEDEEPNEEPSYEYEHDHEDQHDEPPSPKMKQSSSFHQETELDAYERLLAPSSNTENSNPSQHSVLSTLTTTERTTAPDGTVTTKVVLKKRFSDGKEETSETLHTERGHNAESQSELVGEHKTQYGASEQASGTSKPKERKGGWFWSG